MHNTPFSTLPLITELQAGLALLGFAHMTAVQQHSLPLILNGEDVIAQAKTGSGKTAAFGLGILQHLKVANFSVQAMVLCPTRELADQVAEEIRKLAKALANVKVLTLCGGTPSGPQIGSLEHGVHIVVGTPGRILDHLGKGTLNLSQLTVLVLDEADRMLDMGFQDDLEAILQQTPMTRQTLLFSATFPEQIQYISRQFMQKPRMVTIDDPHSQATIEQKCYLVTDASSRDNALKRLLMHKRFTSALVFCNTRAQTAAVAESLRRFGFSAQALHGDCEQRERDETLVRFANHSISVLVATDVAARGLDIAELDCVVNYDIAHDAETHTHRIGRTGRAGSTGAAFTLYNDRETHKLAMVLNSSDKNPNSHTLPPESILTQKVPYAPMLTLRIEGGKKDKLRPGDVLGALTSAGGLNADQVGKMKMLANWSFVAVSAPMAQHAVQKLQRDKLKGRVFKVRIVH